MANGITGPASITGAAAMLLASVGLAACGGSSSSSQPSTPPPPAASAATTPAAASGVTTVKMTLSEYKIVPSTPSVPAGRVAFDVTNSGKIKHQFTVIRTSKPAATVLSKQNPNDDIAGARGEIASIAPGATKQLVIKKLKAGHYALVCALPGHYQSGMHADFTVQ